MVLVGGLCEALSDGRLGNSAVVVDHGEVVGVHRKTHLWDREKLVFDPGDAPSPVVRTSAGRLGLAICYDAFFPEVMRALAAGGAELIVVPANVPVFGPLLQPLPLEVATAVAAAGVNRVFIAQCDRSGEERGVSWVGASAIIDPDGQLLARGGDFLVAPVDLAGARDKRWNERNDALGDRRPELYEKAGTGPVHRDGELTGEALLRGGTA
jgi:predicted amidohydrolase